ncbi:iron-containing alcohol dehydrogenase [Endozoicomonadaceae bacterium StTr2]
MRCGYAITIKIAFHLWGESTMFAMTSLYRARHALLRIAIRLIGTEKPTTAIGPDSSLQLCKMMADLGLRKVMIVTDKPLVELGMIDGIKAKLEELKIQVAVFDAIKPDPTFEVVREGITRARDASSDAILAVGGGSSIDAAKVMAISLTNNKDPQKMVGILKGRKQALPLFVIPTTAGTGSEATVAAVISNDVSHQKEVVLDPKLVPVAAALDPALMTKLPNHITAATGMDALTHAIESYIGVFATDETRFYGAAAARMVFENLPKACGEQSEDLEVREHMALASYYAGLAFTKAHVGYVHAIAHQLGGKYGVPHGLANAVMLPLVLEFSKDAARHKLAELSRVCSIGSLSMSDEQLAQAFIDHIKSLNKQLGIPATLEKIKQQDIPQLATAALKEGNSYPVPCFMDQSQCEAVIARAMVS